jgi:hypothetical protein
MLQEIHQDIRSQHHTSARTIGGDSGGGPGGESSLHGNTTECQGGSVPEPTQPAARDEPAQTLEAKMGLKMQQLLDAQLRAIASLLDKARNPSAQSGVVPCLP